MGLSSILQVLSSVLQSVFRLQQRQELHIEWNNIKLLSIIEKLNINWYIDEWSGQFVVDIVC